MSDCINEMGVAEAEKLVFQVMNKEFKAIIWLGAGLDFLLELVTIMI